MKMKKADFIIIAVVLVVVGVLVAFLYFFNGNDGKYVEIQLDGKVVDTFDLSEDVTKKYDFDGDKNTVVIKDGKVKVSYANCPDGICKNHRAIHRNGESILCLPHKFSVVVVDESADPKDEVDAVA